MASYTARATTEKKNVVSQLVTLFETYPVIALVDIQNLPSLQLQRMRASLRKDVALLVAKNSLISLALARAEKKRPGIARLHDHLRGMPAVLATKQDPFSLASTLKKSRSRAFARAGQAAPNDIIVPAGPTTFSPGPIIGELGAAGIKAGIDAGKVVVKADAQVLSSGQTISAALASILTRLGIEPLEIGLNLLAVYEEGQIYLKNVLEVDEQAYYDNVVLAGTQGFNLAMFLAYPNSLTITPLLQKAHRDAAALGDAQDILTMDNVSSILAKAQRQMHALHTLIPEGSS